MTPDTPSDPQKGKAAEEQEATEAKKPTRARKAAKAQAPAGEEKAAPKKRAAKKAPAAKKTPVAEAAAEEPAAKAAEAAEAPAKAKAPAKRKPAAEKAEEQPKAKPRTRTAEPPQRRRVVRARARYVRTSARKARMVCGHLRGKSVQEARAILAFTPREVARDWSKLLESAVANAESNHELLEDDLIVREAYADEGPTIKRFRPRAMGRATPIRKRTSHLTITLTSGPQPGANNRHG